MSQGATFRWCPPRTKNRKQGLTRMALGLGVLAIKENSLRLLGEETTTQETYNAIAGRVGAKSPRSMYAYFASFAC